MPRPLRLPVTELPMHVVQRGHDRGTCFFRASDYRLYLSALQFAAAHYGVQVHAYALMTNHVHLLVTPLRPHAVSRMLQWVGGRYVRRVNDSRARRGTLWEGRHRACLVASDGHVLAACRYIDLNPVRAGIVGNPVDYAWSSYGALAGRRTERWLVPHPTLEQIGSIPGAAYTAWCERGIADSELGAIRDATRRQVQFAGVYP